MPRTLGSFCAAGWLDILRFPTDYGGGTFWDQIGWNLAKNLDEPNIGAKEWIGLLAYRATGRIEAFYPKACGRDQIWGGLSMLKSGAFPHSGETFRTIEAPSPASAGINIHHK
jgi:hypothetical protein